MHRSSWRRIAASVLVVAVASCRARDLPAGQCVFNSDCSGTLICAAMYCRQQCMTDRDCPAGSVCHASDQPDKSICFPPDAGVPAPCVYNSDCDHTQVCIAHACLAIECRTDLDCYAPGTACFAGRCALVSSDAGLDAQPFIDAGDGGLACPPGFADCDRNPHNGCEVATATDPNNCGACGMMCPAVSGASVLCVAGACGFQCNPGSMPSGGACAAAAPVPTWPPYSSTVTSHRPTLRWTLPSGQDGAHVDVCSDRACTHMVQSADAMGTSWRTAMPFSPGVYFWRVRGTMGGAMVSAFGPTKWFRVGAGDSMMVDSANGSQSDVNGDGYADLVVVASRCSMPIQAFSYLGGPTGLGQPCAATVSPTMLAAPSGTGCGGNVADVGDVNGDGYGDIAIAGGAGGMIDIYYGSPAGLATHTSMSISGLPGSPQYTPSIVAVGDVNADGYADFATRNGFAGFLLFFGARNGAAGATAITPPSGGLQSVAGDGDMNGDGFSDVVAGDPGAHHSYIYLGSATGLSSMPIALPMLMNGFDNFVVMPGDATGDGLADVVVSSNGIWVLFPGASSPPGPMGVPFGTGFNAVSERGGDIDGDGFADFLHCHGSFDGNVTVYRGGTSGFDPARVYRTSGGASFGDIVNGPGDVNGDGFDEVAVTQSGSDRVYLYYGGPTGITSCVRTLQGTTGTGFGIDVAVRRFRRPSSSRGG
jgi:hypothetical protein